MSNIAKAQSAKTEIILDKQVRYAGKIMTRKQMLDLLKAEGSTPEIGTKPAINYNRTKYNRMTDTREQDEYMRKVNERVIEYRAKDPAPSDSWLELNKTEYTYFESLFK